MAEQSTAMTVASTSTSGMPVFNTGLPIVGTIDLNQPMEWVWWGGLALDLFLVQGISKWLIAAGILALRYEVNEGKLFT